MDSTYYFAIYLSFTVFLSLINAITTIASAISSTQVRSSLKIFGREHITKSVDQVLAERFPPYVNQQSYPTPGIYITPPPNIEKN